jgi:hypothetical protein
MKKILLFAALALALPTAVFAGSNTDYTNAGGVLTGSDSGLTLTGSILTGVTQLGGTPVVGNLGSVTFGTGALLTGSMAEGGLFAGGSSSWFTITGNGNGVPNGTLFTGTFSGPVTLTLITICPASMPNCSVADGTHVYQVSGLLVGPNGSGYTVQLSFNTGKGYFDGEVAMGSGDTNTNLVVPEPGSLGLLGTGLIGLAVVVRRKLKA